MAYQANLGRTFVLKARRETVLLVAIVTGVTFALSSSIHSRNAQTDVVAANIDDKQAWTGELSDVTDPTAGTREALTSASLVVPTAELALPKVAVRPLVRLHGCDGSECPTRTAVPMPARRPGTGPSPIATASLSAGARQTGPKRPKPSLMSRLNPLNHLPDMATIRRPFTVAGDTVSGWFRF